METQHCPVPSKKRSRDTENVLERVVEEEEDSCASPATRPKLQSSSSLVLTVAPSSQSPVVVEAPPIIETVLSSVIDQPIQPAQSAQPPQLHHGLCRKSYLGTEHLLSEEVSHLQAENERLRSELEKAKSREDRLTKKVTEMKQLESQKK